MSSSSKWLHKQNHNNNFRRHVNVKKRIFYRVPLQDKELRLLLTADDREWVFPRDEFHDWLSHANLWASNHVYTNLVFLVSLYKHLTHVLIPFFSLPFSWLLESSILASSHSFDLTSWKAFSLNSQCLFNSSSQKVNSLWKDCGTLLIPSIPNT